MDLEKRMAADSSAGVAGCVPGFARRSVGLSARSSGAGISSRCRASGGELRLGLVVQARTGVFKGSTPSQLNFGV
jgi:hypothetical protein